MAKEAASLRQFDLAKRHLDSVPSSDREAREAANFRSAVLEAQAQDIERQEQERIAVAERLQRKQVELEQEQRLAEQQRRDEHANLSSYYPTTVRVDTDMDSSWLTDEERTCQTYPNQKRNGGYRRVHCLRATQNAQYPGYVLGRCGQKYYIELEMPKGERRSPRRVCLPGIELTLRPLSHSPVSAPPPAAPRHLDSPLRTPRAPEAAFLAHQVPRSPVPIW